MSTPRDPDAILAAWLEEGPTALPEPTRRAIAVATRTTNRSRRPFWMPQRRPIMNSYARLAVAALTIVVVIGGAIYLFAPRAGVGVGPPATAAPSLTPSAAPSASQSASSTALPPLDTTGWTTYTSARYGFSIGHPAAWTLLPSDRAYAFPADATHCCPPPGTETFQTPAGDLGVSTWSVAVTPGTTAESWMKAYCLKNTTPCNDIPGQAIAVSMDGHAGSLVAFTNDVQAFTLVGDRMYVVAAWRPDKDATVLAYTSGTRLVESFLSTIHLLPGGPASPAPSATPRPS
jgi:hypothetical protein